MSEDPKKVSNNDLRNSQFGGGFIDAETVNADRIGGDIYNVFPNQQPTLTQQEYRNRQALLTKVKNFWVKGVLEKSLYNQVLIELGLEERPDAITNPWNAILETGESSPQLLPEGTKVINIFDQIGAGRTLLILGEPGSGKTTTLLGLTRDLIVRAEQDINHLIPVVFNLSSWANKRQKIAEWLVEELNTKYDVPKKMGQLWVTQQQLLPLLDGLDEVKAEYREECINDLNQFKHEYGAELVVCSRIRDYKALSKRLNFQSAVSLRLLTLEQVRHYLDTVGADLTGLRELLERDTALQELGQTPLMLHIMTLAYQGVAVEDLPKTEVVEERQKQLFDDYIENMFRRPNRSRGEWVYSEAQTKHWLILLAQKMIQESQTVFLIERMQPQTWLQTRQQQWAYGIRYGFISGLLMAVIGWLWGGLTNGLLQMLCGVLIMVLSRHQGRIEPIETLQWSWERGWRSLIGQARAHASIGLVCIPIATLSFYLDNTWSYPITGIILSLMGGVMAAIFLTLLLLFSGISLVIVDGLRGSEMENRITPNQAIRQSAKNAAVGTLIGWLANGLSLSLLVALMMLLPIARETFLEAFTTYSRIGLVVTKTALAGGLLVGMMLGLGCVFQHFTLRLTLYYNNYIPWNYSRFLDYAAERIFLQKVGGGYIFIHRMLMEHFAQMELER